VLKPDYRPVKPLLRPPAYLFYRSAAAERPSLIHYSQYSCIQHNQLRSGLQQYCISYIHIL